MKTIADEITEFVLGLRIEDLPVEVVDRARDRLLDAISTGVASRGVPTTRMVLAAADSTRTGQGNCTVLPAGRCATPEMAALVNGCAIHSILFEDINLGSADHPGPVVISAALAAAENMTESCGREADLGELLLGIVAGYEVQLYLGAIGAAGVMARGFRTTSVFGTVAAAAAAGCITKLSNEQFHAAVSLAANVSFGLLDGFNYGTMEPFIQAGVAGQQGLMCVRMARAGATVGATSFEGPVGLFHAFADTEVNSSEFDKPDLYNQWRIMQVSCKPYPISGGKITTVDSALAVTGIPLKSKDIRDVVALLPLGVSEFPGAEKVGPFESMSEAQLSTPFLIAAALLGYDLAALRTVQAEYGDLVISALAGRISMKSEMGREFPRIEVTLEDGRILIGEDDKPERRVPSVEKMASKLRALTTDWWGEEVADQLIRTVGGSLDCPVGEISVLLQR